MGLLIWRHVPRPGAGSCPAAFPTPSQVQPLLSHLSFLPGSTSLLPNLRPGPHFLQAKAVPSPLRPQSRGIAVYLTERLKWGQTAETEGGASPWDAPTVPEVAAGWCPGERQEKRTHSSGTDACTSPRSRPTCPESSGDLPPPAPPMINNQPQPSPDPHLILTPVCAFLSQASMP